MMWNRVLASSIGIGDLCFGEAHWILAFFYFKIAMNMPRIRRGQQTKDYVVLNWLGIVFNAVMPIIFGTFYGLEYSKML